MSGLRGKTDILTHQHNPQVLYRLLNNKVAEEEYGQLQFIQRSKIPTMHFQKSLPRLPIPKLELTCERYLAAQRPLLIDEAYQKTEFNVNQFKGTVGKMLQDMLKNYDKQNKHTSYISNYWFDMYLRDRKPIPINYNPFLVLHKDPKPEMNNQLIKATNMIVSSLRFYKSLKDEILEPDVFHINPKKSDTALFRRICSAIPESFSWYVAYLYKAYPLDMSQYKNLFNSTRIPETDKDRISSKPFSRHITVQYQGHFYAFQVLDDSYDILPAYQIMARLKFILDEKIPKCEFPVGIFTTMDRNKWATLRHALADNGNDQSLKLIDTAIFNVCLDDADLKDDPYAVARNFLHGDGENR